MNYNHYHLWKAEATRCGYTVELDGSGNCIVAHLDGVEKGRWDNTYGGCGFGWFVTH